MKSVPQAAADSATMPDADLFTSSAALRDVLAALARPEKTLPGKYLWDETGSALFARICDTEDYYLTRSEVALLQATVDEVSGLIGSGATIVEFGSGASHKVRMLLDALITPERYIAIDISREYLVRATRQIAQDYPAIAVLPVCADYTKQIALPLPPKAGPILGFFPGSTIGNFDPAGAVAFLERARATLGPSWFLVGTDPNMDHDILLNAYGRADGLMAALHKNLLVHLNRLLGTVFEPDDFRHEVRVRPDPFRVEAHLVALRPLVYQVGNTSIALSAGESIHTDSSYKYDPEAFQDLAREAGWRPVTCWRDERSRYCLHLLRSDEGSGDRQSHVQMQAT
jgi:dimethylhistidine N-methyltransferase